MRQAGSSTPATSCWRWPGIPSAAGGRAGGRLRGAGLDRLAEHRTADLSSRRSVEALAEAILAEHGRVAVLVNNAAVSDLTQRTAVRTRCGLAAPDHGQSAP